jgi:cell division protein FtsI/penicillin-binding protein 2
MNKFWILFWAFTALLIAVVVKLFFIQIIVSDKYQSNNYLQMKKILPQRGNVFDRNLQPLVLNEVTYLLYAEPKKIIKKNEFIKKISQILKIGEATLEAKINNNKLWVPIISGLDKGKKEEISKLKLASLGFEEEQKRFYPEGSAAAHLLGFVGKNDKGENIGYFGLEGFYEKDLVGLPGILKTERDLFGNPIFIGVQYKLQSEKGRDLILTIDKTVQLISKEKLKSGLYKYGAKEGCVLVANPSTLEIIALSCLPDFDPQRYYKFSEDYFKNPAISNVYEPGSIFKPLIMAAALNEKAVKPTDMYNEDRPIEISGYEIKTWNDTYEGKITMTKIIEKSSNVGMVYVGQKLGDKKILSYLKQYGIGEITSIDLQGETSGFIKPEKDWYPIDYATATFGQGIVVTPLQMLRAFSSLINGGKILRPYIVLEIKSSNEEINKIEPKVIRRVIEERTSILIKKILEAAVEYGEVKWAKPKGYRIGGKTGTAQIPIKGHYDPTKTIASFIGFAPVDEPKFIILVILKEPSMSPWGSETAAPLFFEIVKELLVYYNIAPE